MCEIVTFAPVWRSLRIVKMKHVFEMALLQLLVTTSMVKKMYWAITHTKRFTQKEKNRVKVNFVSDRSMTEASDTDLASLSQTV